MFVTFLCNLSCDIKERIKDYIFRPCLGPPPPAKKTKEIKDGHHGPKMAASNRYGSN